MIGKKLQAERRLAGRTFGRGTSNAGELNQAGTFTSKSDVVGQGSGERIGFVWVIADVENEGLNVIVQASDTEEVAIAFDERFDRNGRKVRGGHKCGNVGCWSQVPRLRAALIADENRREGNSEEARSRRALAKNIQRFESKQSDCRLDGNIARGNSCCKIGVARLQTQKHFESARSVGIGMKRV